MTARSKLKDPAQPLIHPDGRQSSAALDIARGAGRLLRALSQAHIAELPLANGRRADLIALTPTGDIWIVEIKSSVGDFRADHKWAEYRDFCDRFFFAVAPEFPAELIPTDAGLIVADRYGGEIVRNAPELRLAPARRKTVQLAFARTAAMRLAAAIDPGIAEVVAARSGSSTPPDPG
jgi:hypothetical protein